MRTLKGFRDSLLPLVFSQIVLMKKSNVSLHKDFGQSLHRRTRFRGGCGASNNLIVRKRLPKIGKVFEFCAGRVISLLRKILSYRNTIVRVVNLTRFNIALLLFFCVSDCWGFLLSVSTVESLFWTVCSVVSCATTFFSFIVFSIIVSFLVFGSFPSAFLEKGCI